MLSEEQMYHAKVFIRSYADAHACLQEAARKEATYKHYRDFYLRLKAAQDAKEVELDDAKVTAGANFGGGYFHKLFKFAQTEIARYLPTKPTSADELGLQLDAMSNDLRKRLNEARQSSS